MQRKLKHLVVLFSLMIFCFTGCSSNSESQEATKEEKTTQEQTTKEQTTQQTTQEVTTSETKKTTNTSKITASSIPDYSGETYVEVNNNNPYFTKKEKKNTDSFETYSHLDDEGRCGVAFANVSPSTMPTKKRGAIGMIKPTGWKTVKYDFVDGKYLYNRCHLIGYQLTAENANEQNLITGTRYFNVEGMLPFENMVADYVKETKHHVLYRVTPVYEKNDLVADGVLMEAWSVEDGGDGICFNVFVYNVQPGVDINYKTGESKANGEIATESTATTASKSSKKGTYVINENTNKFHLPSCSSVKRMKESNRKSFKGKRSDLIEQGYEPCKNCNP